MKKLIISVLVILLLVALVACNNNSEYNGTGGSRAITGIEAKALVEAGEATLVDVRTLQEFNAGHIAGALHLPYDEINATSTSQVLPDKSAILILYCVTGRRSSIAADALVVLGYINVRDMGGMNSWPG